MREPAGQSASGGTSNGADRSRSEREGAFANTLIAAEIRYSFLRNTITYGLPSGTYVVPNLDHVRR
jgi:hypothetical protein